MAGLDSLYATLSHDERLSLQDHHARNFTTELRGGGIRSAARQVQTLLSDLGGIRAPLTAIAKRMLRRQRVGVTHARTVDRRLRRIASHPLVKQLSSNIDRVLAFAAGLKRRISGGGFRDVFERVKAALSYMISFITRHGRYIAAASILVVVGYCSYMYGAAAISLLSRVVGQLSDAAVWAGNMMWRYIEVLLGYNEEGLFVDTSKDWWSGCFSLDTGAAGAGGGVFTTVTTVLAGSGPPGWVVGISAVAIGAVACTRNAEASVKAALLKERELVRWVSFAVKSLVLSLLGYFKANKWLLFERHVSSELGPIVTAVQEFNDTRNKSWIDANRIVAKQARGLMDTVVTQGTTKVNSPTGKHCGRFKRNTGKTCPMCCSQQPQCTWKPGKGCQDAL